MARILLIDDEELFREDMRLLLEHEGHRVKSAATGEEGLALLDTFQPDVVICDLIMPGMGGLETVRRLVPTCPDAAILVATAHADMETAIEAFRAGALDVLLKPVVPEALLHLIEKVEERQQLQAEVRHLRHELARVGASRDLLGEHPSMQEIRHLIARVAPEQTPVLVTGESGTGKEVVARAIHRASTRAEGPFVAVNCVAIAGTLFEAELFGHAKGAFTGAAERRRGYFEAASGGTLLLDEVGEIPLELQGKLLRAVERREIVRVGETEPLPVDVRIVASTNRDLAKMVEAESFRSDLFYRLNVIHLHLPPLRERSEDIPLLAEAFVTAIAGRMNRTPPRLSGEAVAALRAHTWPGNVRELQNALERAIIVGDGATIRVEDLPAPIRRGAPTLAAEIPEALRDALKVYERRHIEMVLQAAGGNRGEAARRLQIDPSTLWRKLQR